MKHPHRSVSMVGRLSHRLVGSESGSCVAIDLSSVGAAPFEEFVGVYDDLYDVMTETLVVSERRLNSSKPVLVVGLEVFVDGEPTRPILRAPGKILDPRLQRPERPVPRRADRSFGGQGLRS